MQHPPQEVHNDMRTAGHKIADAVFNFNFASADETVRGAAVLPGLIKAQLVPCMDDIFDRWGPDQDVVRIDHLAVNLGNVAYDDMARVLARPGHAGRRSGGIQRCRVAEGPWKHQRV